MNHQQPEGVVLNIDMSQKPEKGFYVAEFTEDTLINRQKDITLPSVVNLFGVPADNNILLVVNDGLLRTHEDHLTITIDASKATEAFNFNLVIPSSDYRTLKKIDNFKQKGFSAYSEIAVKPAERLTLKLSKTSETYDLQRLINQPVTMVTA